MEINCADYLNDEKCPKKFQLMNKKINSDVLNVIMVGCWGTYCWDGEINMIKYKPPNDEKDDKNFTYFKETKEIYGSQRVVQGMINYTNTVQTHAVFLAGDNVYSYNIPKDRLTGLIKKGNPPSKNMYKLDHIISSQDIDKQLQQGFLDCFNNVKVKDFYVALGNHDVITCYDLNQQLKFSKNPTNRYRLPGVYYNVVYPLENYKVNFIVIDTNMFEKKPVNCLGKKYDPDVQLHMINTQVQWVVDTLKRNNCMWNIIIGHIPYKSNSHKQKDDTPDHIFNEKLNYLFNTIKKDDKCPKVQVYFCADEHNQQFLYDNDNEMALVIAGSGGTVLDKKIIKGEYWDGNIVKTLYYSNNFGFVSFTFNDNDELRIIYFESISTKKSQQKFTAILNNKGILK